eukprot:Phypoly_transcript_10316.p1 GENE.Phypoly_transcript_10316~~Phypoly_transcript_10316.p1  ORF type:complete len:434 (+),score=37.71 Phypoly_transcript_10316:11-1312(+)
MDVSSLREYFLEQHSICIHTGWLKQCMEFLQVQPNSTKRARTSTDSSLHDLIYQQLLLTDMRSAVEGNVPIILENQNYILKGQFLLQIDEIHLISESYEYKFQENENNRVLTFCITDGTQKMNGFEYRPIPSLSINSLPGIKILVSDVPIRQGLLLLSNDNTTVLGGQVSALVRAEIQKREKWELSQKGFLIQDGSNELNITDSRNNCSNNINSNTPNTNPRTNSRQPDNDNNSNSTGNNNNNYNNTINSNTNNIDTATTNWIARSNTSKIPTFAYLIDLINNYDGNITQKEFTILATIIDVIPPLTVKNNKYELMAIVDDGTMMMHAMLSDHIICDLIGNISASNYLELQYEIVIYFYTCSRSQQCHHTRDQDKTILQKALQVGNTLSSLFTTFSINFTEIDGGLKMQIMSFANPQLYQIDILCSQLYKKYH